MLVLLEPWPGTHQRRLAGEAELLGCEPLATEPAVARETSAPMRRARPSVNFASPSPSPGRLTTAGLGRVDGLGELVDDFRTVRPSISSDIQEVVDGRRSGLDGTGEGGVS